MRAIVVDDEPEILRDIADTLSCYSGISIEATYTNPLHALEEAAHIKPDCAFLDIEMPGMNGIELAERLTSVNPHIEVVFITAYNSYGAEAFELNAIDYLLKPLIAQRVEKTVERLLKRFGLPEKSGVNSLKIRCFGAFEVISRGKTVKWTRSKSKELLAYLLQHEGERLSKYRLCDEQWPEYDPDKALAYMQTSLYALRKNLREAGCDGIDIVYADDRYLLTVKEADWDVKRFEDEYATYQKTGSADAAKNALSLYRGEYLEGEDWIWSDIQRENYVCRYERLVEAVGVPN